MANRHRGEISAELDGRQWVLCLTLGGLANLETHFEADGLGELATALSSGKLTADDLVAVLHAGLVGGGACLSKEEVAAMRSAQGAAGYAGIVSQLLAATFAAKTREPGA